MGINSRSSLHPWWVKANIRTVAGFATATVRITRRITGQDPVYDPADKAYATPFITVYEGKARIQPYGINLDINIANDPTARRLVLVEIPEKNLSINNDDILIVTSAVNNTDLMKFKFDVRGSISSSNEWITNLVCETNLKMSE